MRLTLCIIMIFSLAQGQQKSEYVDTQDSLKVEQLYRLAKENSDRQPHEAKKYLYQLVQYIDSLVAPRGSKKKYFNKKKADAYHFLSYYERREHNFDEAALLAQKSIDIKHAEGLDSLLAISYHQKAIAWISVINSMDDGIKQLKKAEQVAEKYKQTGQLLEIYSSFGSAYGVKKDTVNAMKYYDKSIRLVDLIGTDYQKAAIYANYASILRRFNDFEGNLFYLLKAIALHKKNNNKIGLESGLYALGVHYTKVGQPKKGISYLKEAIEICEALKSDAVLPFRYQALSRSYKALGNYKESYKAYVTYHKLLKKRNDVEEAKKLAKLEVTFAFKKQQAIDSLKFVTEKRELALMTKSEESKKYLYLTLFLTTLIGGGIIAYFRNRIHKNREEAALVALEKSRQELTVYTQRLLEKSKEQEILSTELEQLKEKMDEKLPIENLLELSNSRILTKEDWLLFKQKFTLVYPYFLINLKSKGFQFTESEERLLALEKLNLKNSDISTILGIAPKSVMVTRYRLKKKLNIPKEIDLIDFIERR
ncbi:hypothetical protein ABW636_20380 [Aquimarina sp. 2201CG1-2-11]|uniref:tetratricopeptide repeat protein n=1 Tax=Aquimarina discodermiae TaxID=3231043 RepID=UPI0034620840